MITFETQEEFEDAVMDVIANRIAVFAEGGSGYVRVGVLDTDSGEVLSEDDVDNV